MAIAQRVAGYPLGKADLLRRAMGKKRRKSSTREYETFSGGMRDAGYSAAAIKTLWDILLPFSDYAFNRTHRRLRPGLLLDRLSESQLSI